jgi:diguanylate cyclase (GGDEF)-like protein
VVTAVSRNRIGPSLRVGALALVLGTIATVVYLVWLGHGKEPIQPGHPPVVALAAAFTLFEIFVVHFEYREQVHTISLSELALVVGLVFYTPAELLLARLTGSLVALVLHRRQLNIKLLFNLTHFAIEAAVATIVYRSVVLSQKAFSVRGAAAVFAAILSANILGTLLVGTAIALFVGKLQKGLFRDVLGIEMLSALVAASVGLLACVDISEGHLSGLLVVGAVLACVAFRGHELLRKRYASLERLYSFTRSVGTSIETDEAMQLLLTNAADLLRAEVSEITLFDDRGEVGLRSSTVDGRLNTVEVALDPATSLELWTAALGSAVLASRLNQDADVQRHLTNRGFKDALVVPLRRNGAVVGTFLVANRLADVTSFDADDIKLFETIGLHASTTLENGRLVDRLREEAANKEFQSLHDQLTGLANRTLFHRLVEAAIEKCAGSGHMAAVMLMDLDRFKEVNDTLGHHTGDLLLVELSARLSQVVGDGGHIARLGGDEFAILLPKVGDQPEAESVAKVILSALEHPFILTEINLQVAASIGVAMFPRHANDSDALLQLADVAMYQAKANHSGCAVYASHRRQHDARRLVLASELRSAIGQGAIVVYYQPKADVTSRQITGVEALVRWEHPRYGLVPPDEVIPIAEHTGLIRLLTEHVLGGALRQCQAWQALGFRLEVAVNLSVRNLMDKDLPDLVTNLLSEIGLPAEVLTLEITEGTIMSDPVRTLQVLHRIAATGITLAIDDFGTGYSSLSYLKRLPVHEVKIDKTFVHHMISDDDDQVIVRSVIDLARNLRLAVVAEGVEDALTWERLAELGCDSIQGNFLSRPLPAPIFTNLLVTRGTDLGQWGQHAIPIGTADASLTVATPALRLLGP